MSKSYSVFEYNKNTLCSYISNVTGTQYALLFHKKQISYLDNYLKHFSGNNTIISFVCENSYIDKGFMDDYVSFYSRCYSDYGRKCSRLHFFVYKLKCVDIKGFNNFTKEEKEELIKKEKDEVCISSDNAVDNFILKKFEKTFISQDNYLGFMVIRPIPITFISRLCLKTYCSDANHLIEKKYKISLFGEELFVNSIAFQEQDRVVSACATSSLWSMYHAHKSFPFVHIPSASAITKSAINKSGLDMAEGLNPEMIIQEIKNNNLRPYFLDLKNDCSQNYSELKNIIKIMCDSQIPVLLGVDVYDSNSIIPKGKHALTVLGYSEVNQNIVSIYVHDDRYGPYAKMEFCDFGLNICLNHQKTSGENEFYKPLMVIYSVYPKVHIPYGFIKDTLESFTETLISFYAENEFEKNAESHLFDVNKLLKDEIKFHIQLNEINDLRNILKTVEPENERLCVLTAVYPKYIWTVTATIESEICFYLLFDATDIKQGNTFISIVYPSEQYRELFQDYFDLCFENYIYLNTSREPLFELPNNAVWEIAQKFHLKEDYTDYLDKTFGECHFPKRIKDEEIDKAQIKNKAIFRSISCNDCFELDINIEEKKQNYIWVIDQHGYFCIGLEDTINVGHPTLTCGEPGRIGGEIFFEKSKGGWKINAWSGRYSKEYSPTEKKIFVQNVIDLRLSKLFKDTEFEYVNYSINKQN